jgi:hypothetical protein
MARKRARKPTINQSRNVLPGPQIASQRVDSAQQLPTGPKSPLRSFETMISEPDVDAAKASQSLPAPHRELLAVLLRLDQRAPSSDRERPLSPATEASITGETQMHFAKCVHEDRLFARHRGNEAHGLRSPGTLDRHGRKEADRSGRFPPTIVG